MTQDLSSPGWARCPAFVPGALLALAVVAAPPARAQSPDPSWGLRPYEEEKARYDALVAGLEREGHQLLSRNQQVRNETQAFLGNQAPTERARLEQAYTQHADYRNRNDLFERRYETERHAKGLYDDARAAYRPEDERRAGARANLWSKHLEWLRRRNAAREAQVALLDSRLVVMQGLAGFDWDDFWRDNSEDVVYVFDKVLRQYPKDVYECLMDVGSSQLGAWLGEGLGPQAWAGAPSPTLPEVALQVGQECVAGSAYKALVNAFAAAWKKQFLDAMAEKDVLPGVAVYWWDEIVAAELPEEEALLRRVKGLVADQGTKTATGAIESFGKTLAARRLAEQEIPALRQRWSGLVANARPSSKADLTAQMMKTAEERGKQRLDDLMKAAKLGVDLTAKAAELFVNSQTFAAIEANEVARYRRVVACLRSRGRPVTAEAVVDVLRRDGTGFATFLRECRSPDETGACPERLRAALEGLAGVRTARADADRLAGLGARVEALEQDARAAGSALDRELALVREACATRTGSGGVEAELAALVGSQAALVEAACAGGAVEAMDAATRASEIAGRARELARGAGAPAAPPPARDLGSLRDRAAVLASEAAALGSGPLAPESVDRLRRAAGQAESVLAGCAAAAANDELRSLVTEAGRVLAAATPGATTVLAERASAVGALVEERAAAQQQARACLDAGVPASSDRRAALVAQAAAAAERAAACAGAASGSGNVPRRPGPFDASALVGRPLRDAVGIVQDAGLHPLPQAGAPAPSPELKGRIQAATLQGGDVVLVVYTTRETAGTVPYLVGLGLREAHAAVAAAGFTPVVEVGDDAPTPAAANTVASQSPVAGTQVAPGTDVVISIYAQSSPGRVVPSLIGLRMENARDRLASSDLMMDPVFEDVAPDPRLQGVVYRQYPEPSVEVPRGVGVRVWAYRQRQGPAVVERTFEDSRPLPSSGSYDPEPVETPGLADSLGGFVQQILEQKQRENASGRSTSPCRPTGNTALDTVMGQISGRDCEGDAGPSKAGNTAPRGQAPEQGRWGLEGGSSGGKSRPGEGPSTGACKGRGPCRFCEGEIGMPTACMHAIESDVQKQCGSVIDRRYQDGKVAEFFACQKRVIDSWEN